MNTINKWLALATFSVLLIVGGTSCLKDDYFEQQKENIQVNKDDKIIEVRGPIIGSYGQVLNFSTTDTTIPFVTVNLAADQPASEDIKVTLAVDAGVIDEYNERVDETFEALPSSGYQFETFDVTIPKGGREAVLNGKVLDPSFLESGKYALGLKIVSVSNTGYKISGNYGKQVVALRVKNKYHGTYHAIGVFHHPTAGDRDIDEDKELTTEEPNSVRAPLGDLGSAGYEMILTINPDNTVLIEPSGATPNIQILGGGTSNYYDPATQSFHLHYSYTTSAPRVIEEVITRK
ncbi:MAG TPA: DUF1735 domain-containing protein [Niastella sp.]|nr:DUF1735 domain-containing protein [Niastella sp.]